MTAKMKLLSFSILVVLCVSTIAEQALADDCGDASFKILWNKGDMPRTTVNSADWTSDHTYPYLSEGTQTTGSFGDVELFAPPRSSCSTIGGESVYGTVWVDDPKLHWATGAYHGPQPSCHPYATSIQLIGDADALSCVSVAEDGWVWLADILWDCVHCYDCDECWPSPGWYVSASKPLPPGKDKVTLTLKVHVFYHDTFQDRCPRPPEADWQRADLSATVTVRQRPDDDCKSCGGGGFASAPPAFLPSLFGIPKIQVGSALWGGSLDSAKSGQGRLIVHGDGTWECKVAPWPSIKGGMYSRNAQQPDVVTNQVTGEEYHFAGGSSTGVYPLQYTVRSASEYARDVFDAGNTTLQYSYDPVSGGKISYDYIYHDPGQPTAWNEVTKVSVDAGGQQQDVLRLHHDQWGRLLSVEGACSSCGIGGRTFNRNSSDLLTSVVDSNNRTLERYDYTVVGGVNRVTKVSAGDASAGNYLERSRSQYEYTPATHTFTITKRSVLDNQSSRVQIEKYESSAYSQPTQVYEYEQLDQGTIPGSPLISSRQCQADSSGNITKIVETMPSGRTRISDLGTDGAASSQVTKQYMVSGSTTLLQAEYTYTSDSTVHVPRASAQIDARGNRTESSYDGTTGLLLTETSNTNLPTAQQVTGHYLYDSQKRLTKTWQTATGWTSATTFYAYDRVSNLTRSTEALGAGAPLEATTYYEYDQFNHLTKTIDPRNNARGQEYTVTGALTSEYVYASGTSGQVVSQTRYAFDSDGRMAKRFVANATTPFTKVDADPSGEAPEGWTVTKYEYDFLGRKVRMIEDYGTGRLSLTTSYQYNNQDEIVRTTTPGGVYTEIERNGRGLQTKQIIGYVGCPANERLITQYEYDADGNLTSVTSPSSAVTTHEYDGFGRRTKVIEH